MDEYPGINRIRKHVHIYTENPEYKDRAQNQHAGQLRSSLTLWYALWHIHLQDSEHSTDTYRYNLATVKFSSDSEYYI